MNGAEEGRLPRTLGTWSATAVVVGSIIGSGIFRVPATVAAETGSVGAFASLWVLGGVIALCGALSLAELGAAFPRTGGMYVFLREAYGPRMAFLFGWGMLVVNPVSYAAVAVIFAAALDSLVGLTDGGARWRDLRRAARDTILRRYELQDCLQRQLRLIEDVAKRVTSRAG